MLTATSWPSFGFAVTPDTLRCLAAFGITLALFGLRLSARRAEPVPGTRVLNIAKSITSKGVNAAGQATHTVLLFEKQ